MTAARAVPRDLPDAQTEPTMSIARAAAVLGVSERAGYDLAKAGTLPTIKVGKRTLVPTWRFLAAFDLIPQQESGGAA